MSTILNIAPAVAYRFTSRVLAREYILAGQGMFTLVSRKTGKRYTFRVRSGNVYRVDRAQGVEFYAGTLTKVGVFTSGWSQSNVCDALVYLFNVLRPGAPDDVPAVLEIWHEGICARCGRPLTVPSSIQSGFGPVCGAKAPGKVA